MLKKLQKNGKLFLYFAVIGIILILSSLHFTYEDEFDNILGGKLISQGILPYIGFFSHHGPLAYFLAAPIAGIIGQSFVAFRIVYAFVLLGLFVVARKIITRSLGDKFNKTYLAGLGILLAVSLTNFWGNMMLADSLSAFFLLVPYLIVFLKIYFQEKIRLYDLVVISIATSAALLTSFTYFYAVAIIVFTAAIMYLWPIKNWRRKDNVRKLFLTAIIFGIPYFLFAIYLTVSRSWGDFYYDAVIYNRNYYIYNYPRPAGSTALNPLRYAVVILANFIDNYQGLLIGLKNGDWRFPMTAALGATNLFLWIFLLIRKKWLLVLFSFFSIVYVTVRSNVAIVKATDYQLASYIVLTLFNGTFMFWVLTNEWSRLKNEGLKLLIFLPAVAFILYGFFAVYYLGSEWWRMNYGAYMGQVPLIYNRPMVAPLVNQLVPAEHYCWVGPFEFEELYYLRCKLPSRYNWILPQFAGIPVIQKQLLADFNQHQPDVIIFNRNFNAFGVTSDFNNFFVDWLSANYFRLKDTDLGKGYHFTNNDAINFHLDKDFNVRRDLTEALIKKMAADGILTRN